MARVNGELRDGELRLSRDGNSARRVFQVSELTGAASHRMYLATQASGIPRVGDAHPALTTLRCSDVTARPTSDPAWATVDAIYSIPSGIAGGADGLGSITTSLQSDLITQETTFDANGQTIVTAYTFVTSGGTEIVAGTIRPAAATVSTIRRVHRVEVQRPTFSISFERVENVLPLSVARTYSGTVNAGTFQGETSAKWLCNVEATQAGGGLFRVRYLFTLNRDTWRARVTHSSGGEIPDDVTTANGVATYDVYPLRNFNGLGLPGI